MNFRKFVKQLKYDCTGRRSLIVHFYRKDTSQQNETRNPFGSSNFFDFNLLATCRQWILKGTEGCGVLFNKKSSPIPVVNFFEVDNEFFIALEKVVNDESKKKYYSSFVIFNKLGLKYHFGSEKVVDVIASFGNPAKSLKEAHKYDMKKARFRLRPFENCNVVRIEIPVHPEFRKPIVSIPDKYIWAIGSSYLSESTLEKYAENKNDAYVLTY